MILRSVLVDVWKAWGTAQALPVVAPGAHVYGPWENDTFAEDADLTLGVLLTGHGVIYEPRAVSRTAVPEATT